MVGLKLMADKSPWQLIKLQNSNGLQSSRLNYKVDKVRLNYPVDKVRLNYKVDKVMAYTYVAISYRPSYLRWQQVIDPAISAGNKL